MIKNNYGYDLINDFQKTGLDTLTLDVEETPKDLYSSFTNEQKESLLTPSSTAFINTSEASKVGKFFEKHGVYTKADPIYDKYEYKAFWDREETRRKEGLTIPGELYKDAEGYYKLRNIHITAEHYGYLNYARIKRIPDRLISDNLDAVEQVNKDTVSASKEITFPDFWDGDFYFFNAVEAARKLGKHLIVAKARRKGYSYKNGWIAANRVDLYPNTVTALTAYDSGSLYPEGTFKMADNYLQFLFDETDWKKRRLRNDSEGYIKFGYRLKGSPAIDRGYKSILLAESFGPAQPGVLRGKDADLVIVEEAGKARNLRDFLASTLPALGAGRFITGLMIVFGTGGGDDSYWERFEDLFYDPDTDNFLMFENVFDKDGEETASGLFVPDFTNKEGFIDTFGNSNTIEAADYEITIRDKLKAKGKTQKLNDRGMENAFSPSEAFKRSGDNIFPKELIEDQLKRLKKDPLLKALKREGVVKRTNKGFAFKDYRFMDAEESASIHSSINELKVNPNKDNHGCFVQFAAPYRINGVVPDDLYRVWHDPFGVDKQEDKMTAKHSFGCLYVYERVNNVTNTKGGRLVGVYVGRPETTDAYNEMMYSIAKYYNAKVFFEKNTGDVFSFFRQKEELDMLADEAKSIFDKEDDGKSVKSRKGQHINTERKRNGALYLKDWLLGKVDKDEFGNWNLNVHYIYDEGLLKELLKWDLKGNFDRVSTMILGMFDMREQYFVEVQEPTPTTSTDSFFDREWF